MLVEIITKEELAQFRNEVLRDMKLLLQGHEPVIYEEAVPERVELSVSVAQLAILVRAAMETGIIRSRNKTGVIRHLVRLVSTTCREQVSAESLRLKFYSVENGTKEAVKDKLMEMYKKVIKY